MFAYSKFIIGLAVATVLAGCNGSSGGNGGNTLESVFAKRTEVFGIGIYATTGTPDNKLLHAANIMAQYLDNNEDGTPDNPAVVNALVSAKAALLMPANEAETETILARLPPSDAYQDLYASEVFPEGSQNGEFDGSLEEVLHLITHVGYASVYPGVFGEQVGSSIADAMDVARGGRFEQIPSTYPTGAWYTYDDATCDYSCMVTEYTYWALTSILGGQSFTGRLDDIQHEWQLNTRDKVREKDLAVYNILTDQQYGLASRLPNGQYSATSFTITRHTQ